MNREPIVIIAMIVSAIVVAIQDNDLLGGELSSELELLFSVLTVIVGTILGRQQVTPAP